MAVTMTCTRPAPAWQSHKHTESTDSEVSFFDPSTSASTMSDAWSGYFEGWKDPALDNYCPEIVSASNSPIRSNHSDETPKFDPEGLLPPAFPPRLRSTSTRRTVERSPSPQPMKRTKRCGIVPHADPELGNSASSQLDTILQNSMANTEDILAAMYNPDWDVASLQNWYEQSDKSPADLALFKIMFSLRYTTDESSPFPRT